MKIFQLVLILASAGGVLLYLYCCIFKGNGRCCFSACSSWFSSSSPSAAATAAKPQPETQINAEPATATTVVQPQATAQVQVQSQTKTAAAQPAAAASSSAPRQRNAQPAMHPLQESPGRSESDPEPSDPSENSSSVSVSDVASAEEKDQSCSPSPSQSVSGRGDTSARGFVPPEHSPGNSSSASSEQPQIPAAGWYNVCPETIISQMLGSKLDAPFSVKYEIDEAGEPRFCDEVFREVVAHRGLASAEVVEHFWEDVRARPDAVSAEPRFVELSRDAAFRMMHDNDDDEDQRPHEDEA